MQPSTATDEVPTIVQLRPKQEEDRRRGKEWQPASANRADSAMRRVLIATSDDPRISALGFCPIESIRGE
jgi:hypothetical protein